MLELKYSHELTWGDLKYLETPRDALRTIERVHGSKFTLEFIRNAHRHSLPKFGTHKVHNGYNTIQRSLENGNAFLVNRQTQSPILRTLELKEGGQEVEWTLRSHVNDMLRNTLRTVIDRVEKPKPMGVHRQAPSQGNQQNNDNQPPEREKHRILLDLKGQNGRPLPDKHNVTIFVENTTQSKRACKQLNDVIHNPFSKRFITEKGDAFKVYVIPSALQPVVDDLKINGNVSQSESEGLISALSETGQETDTDGSILHHFKYEVPVPLNLKLEAWYSNENEISASDVYILLHDDSDWTQVVYLAKDRKQVLVKDGLTNIIEFQGLPEKGKFTLIKQHQNKHASPITIFSGSSYKDITKDVKPKEWSVGNKIENEDKTASETISNDWDSWLESSWG
ncbi:hypothetical protein HF888_07270 [Bermanella marisrubri]|uniref:Uncharacterized protein n=1 Tax=Bermanella marisrubri TaxID=207949 RepID=Q1N502_9GAMM|nr:hypothetical protein [Bermanella marisrubri]EAT13276.1 hypothetical protein RED65_00910 [Oceanobacter sp. RED65] [Bermanella marisrubri]QIZ84042.1 hypothetical protein HF888_07270 [Bermanella marisrubri]